MSTERRSRVEGPGPCPCPRPDCDVPTLKRARNGHAIGCIGACCTAGRRGKGAERRRHERLSRGTPVDEYAWAYDITVTTQDKEGEQIPSVVWKALDTAFVRGAFKQAFDKLPIGSNMLPAVYLEDGDRAVLIVDVSGRSWR